MPRYKSDFENLAKISETYEIKLIAKITSLRYWHTKQELPIPKRRIKH